jgi:hypothetical protein
MKAEGEERVGTKLASSAFCLLPSAFAFILLPSKVASCAFCLHPSSFCLPRAPVAESADAADLKSVAARAVCRFESGRGHQVMSDR